MKQASFQKDDMEKEIKIGGLFLYNYYSFLLFPTAEAAEFAYNKNWAPFKLSSSEVEEIKRFWLLWYDGQEHSINKELMIMCNIEAKIHSLAHISPGEIFSIVETKKSEQDNLITLTKILSTDGNVGWTVLVLPEEDLLSLS